MSSVGRARTRRGSWSPRAASPRIPTSYLDDAVLEGIQKRIERVVDPGELRRRVEALLPDEHFPTDAGEMLERETRAVSAKIDRLVAVLAAGADDVPSVRSALVGLERERARLSDELRAARTRRPTGQGRAAVVAEILASLDDVRSVLTSGDPEHRKAVVRNFLAEAQVDARAARIVLRWYRLPRDSWVKLVAVGGIEPPTRGL